MLGENFRIYALYVKEIPLINFKLMEKFPPGHDLYVHNHM